MANSSFFRELALRQTYLNPDVLPELYMSLHEDDPDGMGNAELGGYERQRIVLMEVAPGVASNTNILEFSSLPRSTVTHFGIWDAVAEGHFLTDGMMPEPMDMKNGQNLRWREAELVIRLG